MCIAVYDARQESTERIDKELLRRCQRFHPHGLGIMYAHNDRLITWKSLDDFTGLWNRYTSARDKGLRVVLHFRRTSRGGTTLENCHPFKITDDFAFMHNGTIKKLTRFLKDGISDTRFFRDNVLSTFPGSFLRNPALSDMVEDYISGSRLIFMDARERVTIIDPFKRGFWHHKKGEVWFSNTEDRYDILYGESKVIVPSKSKGKSKAGSKGTSGDSREDPDWWVGKHGPRCDCFSCLQAYGPKSTGKVTGGHGHGYEIVSGTKDDESADGPPLIPYAEHSKEHGYEVDGETHSRRAPQSREHWGMVFGYGNLRDDIDSPKPVYLEAIHTAELHGSRLWAMQNMLSKDDIAAATFEDECGAVIHGTLYSISTTGGQLHENLKRLDRLHGCTFGKPMSSQMHRFQLPVNVPSVNGTVHPWVYVANPNPDYNLFLDTVPFGDWGEWLDRTSQGELALDGPPCPECEEPINTYLNGDEGWCQVCGQMMPVPEQQKQIACPECGRRDVTLFPSPREKGSGQGIGVLYCPGCQEDYELPDCDVCLGCGEESVWLILNNGLGVCSYECLDDVTEEEDS